MIFRSHNKTDLIIYSMRSYIFLIAAVNLISLTIVYSYVGWAIFIKGFFGPMVLTAVIMGLYANFPKFALVADGVCSTVAILITLTMTDQFVSKYINYYWVSRTLEGMKEYVRYVPEPITNAPAADLLAGWDGILALAYYFAFKVPRKTICNIVALSIFTLANVFIWCIPFEFFEPDDVIPKNKFILAFVCLRVAPPLNDLVKCLGKIDLGNIVLFMSALLLMVYLLNAGTVLVVLIMCLINKK